MKVDTGIPLPDVEKGRVARSTHTVCLLKMLECSLKHGRITFKPIFETLCVR
jgi:hypothetical protein